MCENSGLCIMIAFMTTGKVLLILGIVGLLVPTFVDCQMYNYYIMGINFCNGSTPGIILTVVGGVLALISTIIYYKMRKNARRVDSTVPIVITEQMGGSNGQPMQMHSNQTYLNQQHQLSDGYPHQPHQSTYSNPHQLTYGNPHLPTYSIPHLPTSGNHHPQYN